MALTVIDWEWSDVATPPSHQSDRGRACDSESHNSGAPCCWQRRAQSNSDDITLLTETHLSSESKTTDVCVKERQPQPVGCVSHKHTRPVQGQRADEERKWLKSLKFTICFSGISVRRSNQTDQLLLCNRFVAATPGFDRFCSTPAWWGCDPNESHGQRENSGKLWKICHASSPTRFSPKHDKLTWPHFRC